MYYFVEGVSHSRTQARGWVEYVSKPSPSSKQFGVEENRLSSGWASYSYDIYRHFHVNLSACEHSLHVKRCSFLCTAARPLLRCTAFIDCRTARARRWRGARKIYYHMWIINISDLNWLPLRHACGMPTLRGPEFVWCHLPNGVIKVIPLTIK